MRSVLCVAAFVCLCSAPLQAADERRATAAGEPRAAALLEQAARTRYTWSASVTAVSGKVTWTQDGQTGSGTFRAELHKRGGMHFTADAGEVPSDVQEHVGSLIGHRTPPKAGGPQARPAAATILVEDETNGPLIMLVNDALQSTERVKDGKLVQVNRRMGGKRFTIDVTEFAPAGDGRFYPSHFTVTWWNGQTGKRVEKQTYSTEGFYRVEGQMFPRAEKVVSVKSGKTDTLELRYSDIKFEHERGAAAAASEGGSVSPRR